ncbi:hypothetical protein [Collinsella aerofaciens]|uniref:hypothetical protein n=1 Tax=Collinsella aerofaciens TaxID=74426 RepID=UPI003D79F1A0
MSINVFIATLAVVAALLLILYIVYLIDYLYFLWRFFDQVDSGKCELWELRFLTDFDFDETKALYAQFRKIRNLWNNLVHPNK